MSSTVRRQRKEIASLLRTSRAFGMRPKVLRRGLEWMMYDSSGRAIVVTMRQEKL